MELNRDELLWIEEQIEEAWDDLRHYPNDHVSDPVNGLYRKVEDAQLKQRGRELP